MNTESKAKELVEKFIPLTRSFNPLRFQQDENAAKERALIAIYEILEILEGLNYLENGGRADVYGTKYWQEVKEHIQNLK